MVEVHACLSSDNPSNSSDLVLDTYPHSGYRFLILELVNGYALHFRGIMGSKGLFRQDLDQPDVSYLLAD